ncbi:hypothetical protein [Pseudomonas sp. CGJS7]|uniref:hypothetical protein n=1 Tax=Pseudomonas sp. CGJS7 TaxID=3109348 RepID=UPI00300805BB
MRPIQLRHRRAEQAELRSVVLRGYGGDALRARQGLQRVLDRVSWTPPELPADAQLLVRRLAVNGHGGGDLSERLAQRVRELARAARRPWRDPDAARADAVWFGAGELAACLIRCQLRGAGSRPWWWQAALGSTDLQEWLREQVLQSGAQVVATVALLAEQGAAATWIARMSAQDLGLSLRALAADYAAPLACRDDWVRLDDAAAGVVSMRGDTGNASNDPISQEFAAARPLPAVARIEAIDSASAPASRTRTRLLLLVPELSSAQLAPRALRLLAYALAAQRDPVWLRTAQFADAVAEWSVTQQSSNPATATRPATPWSAAAELSPQVPKSVPARAWTHPATDATLANTSAQAPASMPPVQSAAVHEPLQPVPPAITADEASDLAYLDSRPHQDPASFDSADASPIATIDTDASPPTPAVHAHCETTTEFGGLFYLLNIALSLGLYADFTAPRQENLSLSPWDWLILIGADWFGDELRNDPIGPLLAALSGREPHEPAGRDFVAPQDWSVADHWLGAWSLSDQLHYRGGRRLRIWHPQGFVLADLPRDHRIAPHAQAAAWRDERPALKHARLQRSHRDLQPLPRSPTRRWIACLQLYLRTRLAHALGMADNRDAAIDLLCRHRAQVRCDLLHIHLHFSLDSLPLPLRLAGLDRDPGWIPAAGRDIRFHYD